MSQEEVNGKVDSDFAGVDFEVVGEPSLRLP